MLRKYRILTLALVCPLVLSCNVYKSFAAPSSVVEYIEEAQRCLADGNYDCAITNYNLLPTGTQKTEKLCIVNIARAGLGISTLIDIVTNGASSTEMLGNLAEQLLPYSTVKEAAAEAAITNCILLGTDDTATLLKTLAYTVDCSVRISKTDTLVATVDAGNATCNSTTPGNASGTITAADITKNGSGTLSGAQPGMCQKDVNACVTDINNASALNGGLSTAGFSGIVSNLTSIAGLSGLVDVLARAQIASYMP